MTGPRPDDSMDDRTYLKAILQDAGITAEGLLRDAGPMGARFLTDPAPGVSFTEPLPDRSRSTSCDAVGPHSGALCVRPAGHYPDSPHRGYVGVEGTPAEWGGDRPQPPPPDRELTPWTIVVTNVGTQDRDYYGPLFPERAARALAVSVRAELERLGRNPTSFHVAAARLQPAALRAIVDDQWGRS